MNANRNQSHAEAHKWEWAGTYFTGIKRCPYAYGVRVTAGHWPSSGLDVDWIWLRDRTSSMQ
jgi:hypothetical protein